jgi:hypothetical protein
MLSSVDIDTGFELGSPTMEALISAFSKMPTLRHLRLGIHGSRDYRALDKHLRDLLFNVRLSLRKLELVLICEQVFRPRIVSANRTIINMLANCNVDGSRSHTWRMHTIAYLVGLDNHILRLGRNYHPERSDFRKCPAIVDRPSPPIH